MMRPRTAEEIRKSWATDPRWRGIERTYKAEDVVRLRGTLHVEHTLARRGAQRLWNAMRTAPPVRALGALTGNQAIQQVAAGLGAIYVSGWQVAADANGAGQMYPDQSLYPADSVPALVRRINHALERADQIAHLERIAGMVAAAGAAGVAGPEGAGAEGGNGKGNRRGSVGRKATAANGRSGRRNGGRSGGGARAETPRDWFAPIVADAEAGFGGDLNAFELMKAMIEAGAAGVHFEDQLASAKKCGHMGGKVLIPTREFTRRLAAARLAADLLDVPTVLVARTDADSARLITSDIDERDRPFLGAERTPEGFHCFQGGQGAAIARGLAYAPHADVLWCETSAPDLDEARRFAEAIHARFPGKLLAYNCSPSFNWSKKLDPATIARFQSELGAMGYAFQFVTLAGFHALNLSMFELACGYRDEGMTAYARLQDREFECQEGLGYAAVKHQGFVGTGYFDEIARCLSAGRASTAALKGSTEAVQF